MSVDAWTRSLRAELPSAADLGSSPWRVGEVAAEVVRVAVAAAGAEFVVTDGVAVHASATVEPGAVLKGPVLVSPGAFVAAHAYLRGGVYVGPRSTVGPGCELKAVLLLADSAVAHLSFVGDSIVGSGVNIEAGVVVANRRNETGRSVEIRLDQRVFDTGQPSFGALIGDGVRVGASSVLSPGTLLEPGVVVPRLTLVDQTPVA